MPKNSSIHNSQIINTYFVVPDGWTGPMMMMQPVIWYSTIVGVLIDAWVVYDGCGKTFHPYIHPNHAQLPVRFAGSMWKSTLSQG
jgi:hypothetical protein